MLPGSNEVIEKLKSFCRRIGGTVDERKESITIRDPAGRRIDVIGYRNVLTCSLPETKSLSLWDEEGIMHIVSITDNEEEKFQLRDRKIDILVKHVESGHETLYTRYENEKGRFSTSGSFDGFMVQFSKDGKDMFMYLWFWPKGRKR